MKVAIGAFDGVHRGHTSIINKADAIFTFAQDPDANAPNFSYIMPPSQKKQILESFGKPVIWQDFTEEFRNLTAEEFIRTHLKDATQIVVGEDFRCGRDKKGVDELARYIDVIVMPPVLYDGERISSTRIREALQAGNVHVAEQMLGREPR